MADGTAFLNFDQELVVDLFAGGGGASTGIARAYREPDVAVNHNAIAIAVHRANHPHTEHYQADVFEVDPLAATRGRPVGLLWASPDCRHHSKAKGKAPRSKRIRGLAWVVVRWGYFATPRVIEMENVEEFIHWCPLDDSGSAIAERKGETFRAFIDVMTKGLADDHPAMDEIVEFLGDAVPRAALVRGLGYTADWREIRACDKGAKTIRKRLVIKFRRDGRPITWSPDTHAAQDSKAVAAGKLKPYRTAAECIDFSLPARSIFGRKKPLATNTLKRIAKGMWRYVLNCPQPFIVPLRGTSEAHTSTHAIDQPLSTITGGGTHHALVTPYLTEHANGSSQRVFPADDPLRTQVAQIKGGHFSLVAPALVQTGYGEREGQEPRALDIGKPLGTVVAGGVKHALVAAHITKFRFNSVGSSLNDPMHTITAGGAMKRPAGAAHALGPVSAFLEQANGGFYDGDGRDLRDPVSTICASGANQRLVSAYLVKYYGEGGQWQGCDEPMHTVPTKDRMGLIQCVQVPADTLAPELRERAKAVADFLHEYLPEHFPDPAGMVLLGGYVLADITLRMLVPRELARAQGFPDSYIIDRGLFETAPGSGEYEWRQVTKTDQVRLIGNSVCPDMAAAEVANDLADLIEFYARAA
jgi:DNA (cytosine-5)-methyltransferase 1